LSAISGEGLDRLGAHTAAILTAARKPYELRVDASDGAALAWLHAHGSVDSDTGEGEDRLMTVRLTDEDFARFAGR